MIAHIKGSHGEFLESSETVELNDEWEEVIDNIVRNNLAPTQKLIGNYSYKWATINGAKCIQIDYRRTGIHNDMSRPVVCRIALFQNDNEMIELILSYREKEAEIWKSDFQKIYNSFKWE